MATRQPFWKWHRWTSIDCGPWHQTTCIWNLKLKFQSKLELHSGNHANYRVQILKNPIWPPGGAIFKVTLLKINRLLPYTQVMCQWSLNMIFKAKLKLESGNRKIRYGRQAAILKVTLLKINTLLSIHTGNLPLKFGLDIQSQIKLESGNWKI